jgi:hypothetical protein
MQGEVMAMPISDATGQEGHMHSIFWGSQGIIIFPSMLQNRPILGVMAGFMQEVIEEEVIEEEFIEEVLEQSMFMLQSFTVLQP